MRTRDQDLYGAGAGAASALSVALLATALALVATQALPPGSAAAATGPPLLAAWRLSLGNALLLNCAVVATPRLQAIETIQTAQTAQTAQHGPTRPLRCGLKAAAGA